MIRKLLAAISLMLVALLAVVVVKTLGFGPPAPAPVPPADSVAIDQDAVAVRLGEAVRFQTISHGTDAPVAEEAFRGLHDFLARSYPRVQAMLTRETVSD